MNQISEELADRIYQCHCNSMEEWQIGNELTWW